MPDTLEELPWDDKATGELQCRGPWIAAAYYRGDTPEQFTEDGWLRTGDVAAIDPYGSLRLVDRTKDLIKTGGEWVSSVDLENQIMAHPAVAEAAVVGFPHDIKGQGIYAYVTLKAGEEPTEPLRKELVQWVRKEIGPIATPDLIQWAPSLPKTRSGKIMRRILRKIAANEQGQLGDVSTLADPAVVTDLVDNRMNRG